MGGALMASACRPAGVPTAGGLIVTGIEYSGDCGVCTRAWNERQRQIVPVDALLDAVPWLDETGVSSLPGGTIDGFIGTDSTPHRLIVHFANQPSRSFDVNDCFEPSVCAFLDRAEKAKLIHRFAKGGCDGSFRADWGRPARPMLAPTVPSDPAATAGHAGGICDIDPTACPRQADVAALSLREAHGPDGRCRIHRDGWPVGTLSRSRASASGGHSRTSL